MGARQSIDPLIYIYPTAYMYILAGLYGVLYISGTVIGIFSNTGDFAIRYLIDPSLFYLAGRVANILFSLLTVLILYVRSQKLFGETTARFAAFYPLSGYYYIQFSRFAVSDTLLILFSTLAILTLLETYRSASRKNYLLSGFFIGLAIGMKYNAGFLVLGLFTLIILHWREHRRENLWKYGSASIFAIIVGFLVFNPLWLLRFSDFYDGYIVMSTQMQSAVSLEFGLNYIWEIREIISHELVIGIGFFVSTLFFLIKRKSLHLILLIPLLVTFLYVGSWQKKGVDYLFAIFPAWIVLFSMWLDQVWGKLEKQKLLRNTLIVLCFFLRY